MEPASVVAAGDAAAPLTLATLPSDLQWLVLSHSSLVDLPALNRVCSSFHWVLCELLHPPRIDRPLSSSPRSSCVSLLSSPLPPLASHFHHARPLLTFLAATEPSYWRLLTSRDVRLATCERYVSPPPLIRRLLRRFTSLRISFRRKQSRATERLRLVDTALQLAVVLPASVTMLIARSVVLSGSADWPPPPLAVLWPSVGSLLRCGRTAAVLLAYVAALTACDAQLAVRQRANADMAIQPADSHQRQEAEEEERSSDDDSDMDQAEVEEEEEEEGEEAEEDGDVVRDTRAQLDGDGVPRRGLVVVGHRVRVDGDIAFQRRMLQSAEALMRARQRRRHRIHLAAAAAAIVDPAAPPSVSTLWCSTAALAVARARSTLKREDGSSLFVRLLSATLSAVRHELLYRHVLVAAVYASLAVLSSLLRRLALLDGIRLLVDGLIPVIPLLVIAHSVLNEMDAAPAALARLLEQLHHPRLIVALRLTGLLATLAANTALYRPLLIVFDRLLMPAMEALTLRSLQLPRLSTSGGRGSVGWVSPFAIDSHSLTAALPAFLPSDRSSPASVPSSPSTTTPSVIRLFALSLFVSQLLSSDDSRCLDASRCMSGGVSLSLSLSGAVHRWLLSVALLHIRLSGGAGLQQCGARTCQLYSGHHPQVVDMNRWLRTTATYSHIVLLMCGDTGSP